ncbi:MAG: hypothetical protein D6730_08695 [Bacteroidetes bacterium]|nr:MAG: hypothetical protein D6730_08695 [Bacteroidota bacterium]
MKPTTIFLWLTLLSPLMAAPFLMAFMAAKPERPRVLVAQLDSPTNEGLEAIRQAFSTRNPGYELDYASEVHQLQPASQPRVVFVQKGGGTASLSTGESSKVAVGDLLLLQAGTGMQTDSLLSMLIFVVPTAWPDSLPAFIRPDWDPRITDTPGGCATETGAYRRILLTWLGKVGPYLYHSLNAHRVRIMDSFSHYHPEKNGFDEFYLVQMVMPGAKLITSERVDLIEHPEKIKKKHLKNLLQYTELSVGDLVYLPRGTMHRGVGGVLAQVITVPGFIPGSEIGLDHHLRAINERLGLTGGEALPYHEAASEQAVIK